MSVLEQTTLAIDQGDTGVYVFGPLLIPDPVSGAMVPLDLTQGGMKAWFTAKTLKTDSDANAVIRKGSTSTGFTGITLNSPTSADKNYGTLTIDSADTDSLAAPLELFFDLQLVEPNGRKTTIRRGILAILADVTNA